MTATNPAFVSSNPLFLGGNVCRPYLSKGVLLPTRITILSSCPRVRKVRAVVRAITP